MHSSFRIWLAALLLAGVLCALTSASAHRSGCHRWHSCPSDTGIYVCGDTGYCSQCPDNQYCLLGKPRPIKEQPEKKAATEKRR